MSGIRRLAYKRRSLLALVLLAASVASHAAPPDRSDMNADGVVDEIDLAIFSDTFLQQDYQTVDWCAFYEASIADEKYFRNITSDKTSSYQHLLDYIALTYDCKGTSEGGDKSDMNADGVIDLADLILFSEIYLERYWETVDWCAFYDATIAGEDFEGKSTAFYLQHFTLLLEFINGYFSCDAPPPPPSALQLENQPKLLVRMARGPNFDSDYYITDPLVGSLFIFDTNLELKAEIKALNKPLGVAVDSQGYILVGNDGRDNVEIYDPANGQLVTVIGEGTIRMPTAITVDDLGNIYVTDAKSNTVRVFDPTYVPLRTIGRSGTGKGGLRFPVDTVVVNSQEVLVADQGNDRIQVYALDGTWLRSITFEGTEGQNCNWFTGVCEIPGAPAFNRIKAMDIDSLGRLHVLDNLFAAVVILDPANGSFEGSYGGYGTEPGTLTVPMDVLLSPMDTGIVTSGDGDRIEFYTLP